MAKFSTIFISLVIGAVSNAYAATPTASVTTSVTTQQEAQKVVTSDDVNSTTTTNPLPVEDCVNGKTKDGKPCQPKQN